MDSVRHRKIGRCGQFIGAGGPAVRAVRTDQLGTEDCSSVRRLGPARHDLKAKGKIGKSKFLQTVDEAKVKHNSLAIIFEFPALF